MNRISLATGLATVLFLTPSCTESAASGPSGTYKMDIPATVAGLTDSFKAMMQGKADDEVAKSLEAMLDATMELKSDNTFTGTAKFPAPNMDSGKIEMAAKDSTNKGTWSIKDGTITLEQTHEDGAEKKNTLTATLKDGLLTVTMKQGAKDMKLIFKKQ